MICKLAVTEFINVKLRGSVIFLVLSKYMHFSKGCFLLRLSKTKNIERNTLKIKYMILLFFFSN